MSPHHPSRALAALLGLALAATGAPPAAAASAEPGLELHPVELATVDGGRAPFLSTQARANVFVFFRSDGERSAEALKAIAGVEAALAGKGVHWAAVVSGSEDLTAVKRVVAASGVAMPVLVDAGDALYDKLRVRVLPSVGIADGRGVLQGIEPYRELDFADVLQARIRLALGEIDRAALARALDPEASPLPNGDPVKRAATEVKMARRLLELGQWDAAVKRAQRALEAAPVADAYPVLGIAYARLGRCSEARRMLDQAQKLAPASADLAAARALCAGK